MAKDVKKISVKDFREMGLLYEVNRRVLHPLGLALEVAVEEDGTASFGKIWDCRDDPEGILFGDEVARKGLRRFKAYLLREGFDRLRSRHERLGLICQDHPDGMDDFFNHPDTLWDVGGVADTIDVDDYD